MAYTFNWENKGVCCTYSGVLTNEDLIEADRQIMGHPDFKTFRYGIADFSAVDDFQIQSSGVMTTSSSDRAAAPSNPDFRVAIVASATVMKGFARMWELTGGADIWETKIFRDIASARAWLENVPDSTDTM